MKVNQLLSLLIVFVILFSFLFLMSRKVISPFLSPRPLNLARIKNAYKENDKNFSERIIFFHIKIFFSIFLIELALLFFFHIFLNIDRFHPKKENKTNKKCLIEVGIEEDEDLNNKKERLKKLIQKKDLQMKLMKKKFFYRFKEHTKKKNIDNEEEEEEEEVEEGEAEGERVEEEGEEEGVEGERVEEEEFNADHPQHQEQHVEQQQLLQNEEVGEEASPEVSGETAPQ